MSVPLPSQGIENPQTIGEHLRNRRLELKLLQSEVAKLFEMCEDTITGWENGRSEPQVQYYPSIIQFLGYYPFPIDTKSIGGQIRKYRFENGLSYKRLSKVTGFSNRNLASWEKNISAPSVTDRMKLVILDIIK